MRKNIYRIRPIPLVKKINPKPIFTYLVNWGQHVSSCDGIWLIEGLKNIVIVDTGRSSLVSTLIETQFTPIQSLEDGLGKLGIQPGDVDIVILTHLHYDHIELANKYKKAKFITQRAELDFAIKPGGFATKFGYKPELIQNMKFEIVEGDCEIFPGVKLLLTPGHTPGGQSVAINTKEGIAVITGFCCIRENFEPPEKLKTVTPMIVPGIHLNVYELYESMFRIKEIADIIVPLHDLECFQKNTIPNN